MISLPLLLLAFAAGAVLCAATTPVARRIARMVGAIDMPGDRRVHDRPIPRLGGLAIVFALVVGGGITLGRAGDLLAFVPHHSLWIVLGLCTGAIMLIGAIDDARPVPARWKFVAEVVAAVAFVQFLPIEVIRFGQVEIASGFAADAIIVLWLITITNAFNMIDGLDGLSAGIGAIAAATLAVAAVQTGRPAAGIFLMATCGSLSAFLLYNGAPARIFMGDSGTLPVGFLLGALSVVGQQSAGEWSSMPAVFALAVPLLDLITAVSRRTIEVLRVVRTDHRRERFHLRIDRAPSLFTADGRHIHHRLLARGMSPRGAVLSLYSLATAFGLLALSSSRWEAWAALAGAILITFLGYLGSRWLYDEFQLLRRGYLLPMFDSTFAQSRVVHAAWDFVAIGASYCLARWALPVPIPMPVEQLLMRAAAAAACGVIVLWVAGVYRFSFRRIGVWVLMRAIRGVILAVIAAAAIEVMLFRVELNLGVWLLTAYVALTAFLLPRAAFKVLHTIHQRAREEGRRVAVFAAGRAGVMVLRELLENPHARLVPVGMIDDDPTLWFKQVDGYMVYPGGARLRESLTDMALDALILSSEKIDPARRLEIHTLCSQLDIAVMRSRMSLEDEELPLPVVTVTESPARPVAVP